VQYLLVRVLVLFVTVVLEKKGWKALL